MYCDTVGIDLGTTRSSVAVWDGKQVHVIANESGDNTTPSWVCYTGPNQRRVGKAAERAASKYIQSTVFHAKRLIGRPFSDSIQDEGKTLNWPFQVVDNGGNAGIQIKVGESEETMIVSPEEAGAAVLSNLKKVAEEFIGRPVHKAVVTVPAYFSDSQRQATRDAGLIADLDVTRILNEPTAAALAFGVLESMDGGEEGEEGGGGGKSSNMLVFDFGGGTLDVTIMEIQGQSFKVKSTDGDMRLGGEDIDALLVAHFVKVCKAATGVDLERLEEGKKKSKAYKRLYGACSRLKVDLSRTSESDFTIDDLVDGVCFEASLDRPSFDGIVSPLLERIRIPIDRALQKVHGGMKTLDVDRVLLVGGSSRIPLVQEILQDLFPGTEMCRRINPDEAIVIGAAIEASRSVDLVDIVPRPLSIATANHQDRSRSFATQIIAACTPIQEGGITLTECFANSRDNQDCVTIRVCEGEAEMFDDNVRLGVFEITDIPPRPRGQVTIKVTMKVDSDGILSVVAVVEETGQTLQATVTSNKGRMTQEQLQKAREDNRGYLAG